MRHPLRVLVQNWQLKLLALALAVLLWIVVSAEQVTSNWIPVPLHVRVTDPEYRLVRAGIPSEVEVRFSGPGRELWDLVIRRPPLLLNIADVNDGEQVFNLDGRMVQVPSQLSAVAQDVRPGSVSLRFARLETRFVPVRVRTSDVVGSSWTLVDTVAVTPSRVRVTGPADRVAAIDAIHTRPFSATPGDSLFSRTVPLDTAGLEGVQLSVREVRVTGRVDRLMERTFLSVPIAAGPGLTLRPTTADVRLYGPARVVQSVMPMDFRVVVAIDSVPEQLPAEGLVAPLRVERLPLRVRAEPTPRTVRLFAPRPVADTLQLLGSASDTTRRPVQDEGS